MSQPRANAPRPNGLEPHDHQLLRKLLHDRTGVVLDTSRDYFVEMRLGALATEAGFDSLPDVMDALRTEETWGVLHRMVVETLAIAETSWFRDAMLWEELRHTVLPRMMESRAGTKRLHLWSAACATGQEPYSLSMVLQEEQSRIAGWDVRILATDFSQAILKRARAGEYTQIEMNRGLPAPYLVRHFRKVRDLWVVKPELKARVEFQELNLAQAWPLLPQMDLVLMRNVLLYFEPELRKRVLRQLTQVLQPEGILVLGAGETTLTMDDSFEAVPLERTVVYRRRAHRSRGTP